MKAKVHSVTLFDRTFLVMARSKAGALRDLFENLKESIKVEPATGQQVYEAGRDNKFIVGLDKYESDVDPNQQELSPLDVELPE